MAFLRENFEKMLVGLALLGLLGSSYYLLHSLNRTRGVILKADEASKVDIEGKPIDTFKVSDFRAAEKVLDPRIPVQVFRPKREDYTGEIGNLMEPASFTRCVNPECFYLLPWHIKKCPACAFEQPPEGEKRAPGLDTDEDGIPDAWELLYPQILNPQNTADAFVDTDRDSFTNVEEFKGKTLPTDPRSHPPMIESMRFMGTFQNVIPVRLRSIRTYDNEDPAKWDISLISGKKRKVAQIGETVYDAYRIVSAVAKTEVRQDAEGRETEVDLSEVVIERTEDSQQFTLVVEQPAMEPGLIARFIQLTNRVDPRLCRNRPQVREGEEFTVLQPLPNVPPLKYRLVKLTPQSAVVQAVDPNPNDEKANEPVEVKRWSPRDDYPMLAGRQPGQTDEEQ